MTSLAHQERTLQDVIDEMTPAQRELMDLVVGAAVEDEVIDDVDILNEYDALSDEQRYLIDFTVGNVLAEAQLEHDAMLVGDFLAHYGVKGMQWGVRKSETGGPRPLSLSKTTSPASRAAAKERVASGTGTLGDAHKAALKTTGHRVINALSGDKTFWKRMAITTGVAATAGAVLTLGPFALPAAITGAVGAAITSSTTGAGIATGTGLVTNAQIGTVALSLIGAKVTQIGFAGATAANVVGNTARAVGGNTRINRSAAKLGSELSKRQNEGSRRTQKILRKSGSVRKSRVKNPNPTKPELKQSEDLRLTRFLEHHASVDLGTMKSGV